MIPVKDKPGLIRDPSTNAIINSNSTEYERSKAAILLARRKDQQLNQVTQDVEKLNEKLSNIELMLAQLIQNQAAK